MKWEESSSHACVVNSIEGSFLCQGKDLELYIDITLVYQVFIPFKIVVVLLSGERRIRVHTLCVAVSSQPAHVYAGLNVQAITVVLAMMGKH